jgi:type IV secretory pathway VirB4 component
MQRLSLLSLKNQIPVKEGVRRKLTTIDFTFYYGGTEIALFANSGLSPKGLEGTVQDFSNLDNARGLFSSLSTIQVNALFLSNQSIDTIALNSVTKPLNFLKSHEEF